MRNQINSMEIHDFLAGDLPLPADEAMALLGIFIDNLTEHDITVLDHDGNLVMTIEPSGTVARCDMAETKCFDILGIPVMSQEYGKITGLPEPKKGHYYICSRIVAAAAKRHDVLCPGAGVYEIKDGKKILKGITSFSRG